METIPVFELTGCCILCLWEWDVKDEARVEMKRLCGRKKDGPLWLGTAMCADWWRRRRPITQLDNEGGQGASLTLRQLCHGPPERAKRLSSALWVCVFFTPINTIMLLTVHQWADERGYADGCHLSLSLAWGAFQAMPASSPRLFCSDRFNFAVEDKKFLQCFGDFYFQLCPWNYLHYLHR